MTTEMIANVALAFIGFSIGAKLPDIDLAPVFPLRHRSMWTHGPLIALALAWFAGWAWWAWWLVAGLLPSLLVHLLLDCFPKHWRGSATVKLYPIPWSLNPLLSFLWIGAGAVTCGAVWWSLIGRSIMAEVAKWL